MIQRCILCRYFDDRKSDADGCDWGICRRNSPSPETALRPPCASGLAAPKAVNWPAVALDDYCGDFKLPISGERPE